MKYAAILLILFAGWFINSLSVSPIYIAFVFALILIVLQLISNSKYHTKIRFSLPMTVGLIFVLYIFFTQIMLMQNIEHAVINVLFSLVYFLLISMSITSLSFSDIKKYFRISVNLIIPLLCFEAVYRWTHPILRNANVGDLEYYKFKYSSIMYQDSNFVGIFIVVIYFMCTYMRRYHGVNLKKQQIILFIFAVLTLSKASIATIVVFSILYDFNFKKWVKAVMLFFALIIGLPTFMQQIVSDNSLMGKLNILNYAMLWWEKTSLFDKLFGVGYGNAVSAIGMGSHNIIISYFVESGVLGLILFIVLLVSLLYETGKHGAIVILPFMLNAMSLSSHAIPYFYCYIAIIACLEKASAKERVKINEQKANRFISKQKLLRL